MQTMFIASTDGSGWSEGQLKPYGPISMDPAAQVCSPIHNTGLERHVHILCRAVARSDGLQTATGPWAALPLLALISAHAGFELWAGDL